MKGHLKVSRLTKRFRVGGGFLRPSRWLTAVDNVSFEVPAGTTFGLVGESGCGKSTLGRCVLRLNNPDEGEIELDGVQAHTLKADQLFSFRRRMQVIFQDPYASLSPRRTIAQTLLEPLNTHRVGESGDRLDRVVELLELVGLRPGVLHRYPHEFSGGQRQRVGIARALALDPDFIVADEAVSALDVSVQSQVLNLLRDIQRDRGMSYLFISHDLAVVQHISDRVGVMYLGRLVEVGNADDIFCSPRHPYTQALLSAVPVADPEHEHKSGLLEGDVPSPLDLPPGCPFHTRCPHAMSQCSKDMPEFVQTGSDSGSHTVRCHLFTSTEQRSP